MTSVEIFEIIRKAGVVLAEKENLPLKAIERNAGQVKAKHRAHCTPNGIIRVKLRSSQTLEVRTKFQEIGRDVCHELAHLKYHHHGPDFWKYQAVLCHKMSEELNIKIIPERSAL